ncbi:MAG TPA: hypothetical protein VK176_13995 [Phycisphaerales bacterium]|nr:hypothetical protein [Phycisphaerales bacterium]
MSPSPSTPPREPTPAPTSLLFRPRMGLAGQGGGGQHLPTANDIFIEYLRCLREPGTAGSAGTAGR